VFKGIGEFAINAPRVITGNNYDQQNVTGGELFGKVRINIFNISKINSEVRGGKEPRIKRMREVLGESYFNHLANLPNLVLLMDESHRYRAQAGMRAINELNPLFGLEVTATPFVESAKAPIPFKNVVMDYLLVRAWKMTSSKSRPSSPNATSRPATTLRKKSRRSSWRTAFARRPPS